MTDHELAAALAQGAGRVLLAERDQGDTTDLRARGDAAAQAYLARELTRARPHDAVLSEEAADDGARLSADRVWVVDPLDGTREYAERHDDGSWRDDWAVHVALWQRGRGLVAGAVALPGRGTVLRTDARVERPARRPGPLRLAVSRSRPPALVDALATLADVELVPMGSAGVKVASVVTGRTDAYVHAGGQYEWDSAAPVAVATAAGLHCSRVDGAALEYNRRSPWLPDLLVCEPERADELLGLVARAQALVAPDAPPTREDGAP
ncbi:3'(2'),5'-bisphosphate nucleotidase CysQ [Cellulomonas uda]|uniref:3'(2'),5'-bisphosphate nucleotidase CysQ n=1 Tax=Cellulomonas uda TaxID=1714 RepID=A0A4Y3K8X5_CELUD|nr:3'(2'),5'-bisphosphate nucleotidase CysQ [Cellulomonas uda]NII65276.1 3'(2'), 5'-bisphosphate nucleotidase [Cellulomonas uda]GEA79824.1 3'(2'),5'-bisphosphate nucleotidase CysQ [Cellulomonas uda]